MSIITTKSLPSREERAEVGKKAQVIYEPLRPQLEKDHWGEYITLNLDNGDYVIAREHKEALKKMRAKYSGVLFYTIRIGYRAVFHFRGLGATDGQRPAGRRQS